MISRNNVHRKKFTTHITDSVLENMNIPLINICPSAIVIMYDHDLLSPASDQTKTTEKTF